ncbi:hypothetical protein [Caballeronia sp. LZ043]|uniref:hypothetical protein n=1 Tax=Caballeronia sp. LZ043 TaxID=3038569 RepID=UPI002869FC30|nr:hypothetical protein [Caballeronia sp. LZ043]
MKGKSIGAQQATAQAIYAEEHRAPAWLALMWPSANTVTGAGHKAPGGNVSANNSAGIGIGKSTTGAKPKGREVARGYAGDRTGQGTRRKVRSITTAVASESHQTHHLPARVLETAPGKPYLTRVPTDSERGRAK